MKTTSARRRRWLKGALAGAAAGWWPRPAPAQPSLRIRQEWRQFRQSGQYQSFLNAIAAMGANTDPQDRGSLAFWAAVHVQHCPHGAPYFLSWHRGYLYYFEQQLRAVSGDPDLNLPYWDYYAYATLPPEFTDPAPANPLYRERAGGNVHGALDLAPFAPAVFNFQHGRPNAFEPRIEDVHNPVHDLIGGVMSTMESPLDPIFYLHHASIDRLTHAWALPDGKGIPFSSFPYSPANSDPYWAGENVYASDLSIERYRTLDPAWLGIDYADTSVPVALPAAPVPGLAARFQSLTRPPFRMFAPAPRRLLSTARRVLAGVLQPLFDERSVSVQLRLDKRDAAALARALATRDGAGANVPGARDSRATVKLVIDRALLAAAAGKGGFFYALYLNMPVVLDSDAARQRAYIGTLGAFQVAAASHHGAARVEFDVTELLAQQQRADWSELTVSWLRVDGDKPPAGRAIHVGELRLDLALEARAPQPLLRLAKPRGWYGGRAAAPAATPGAGG